MAANEKGRSETQNRQVNINMMEVSEEFLFKAQSIQELLGLQLKSSQERCIQLQQQLQERQATVVNMESQIHLLETRVSGLQHENASQRKNYHRLDQKFRYHMKFKDDEIESLKAVIASRNVRTRTSSTSAVASYGNQAYVQENDADPAIANACTPRSLRRKEGITTTPVVLMTEKNVNSKIEECGQPGSKAALGKSVAVPEKQKEHSKDSQPQECSLTLSNKGGFSTLSKPTNMCDTNEDQAVKSQASEPSENSTDFRALRSHASDWMASYSPTCVEENKARGDKQDVPVSEEQEKSVKGDSIKTGDSSKTKNKVKPPQTTDDNSNLKDNKSLDSESSSHKLAKTRQDRTSVEQISKSVKESFSDKTKSETVERPPASMSSSETSALDAPRRKRKQADSETEMPLKRKKHSESTAVESRKVIDLKTYTHRKTSSSESEKDKKDKSHLSSPGDKENESLNQKKSDKESCGEGYDRKAREKSLGEKKNSAMTDLDRMKAYSAVAKRRELVQKIEAKDTRKARNRLLKEQAQNQANQKEVSLIKNAKDSDQEAASAINNDAKVSLLAKELSSEPVKEIDKMQEPLSEAKDSTNKNVLKDTCQLGISQSKTVTSSNIVSDCEANSSGEKPESVSEQPAQVSNASDIFKMLKKTTPSVPRTAATTASSGSSSELAVGGQATTASDVFKLLQQTSHSSSLSRKPAQFPRSYRIPRNGGQPSPRTSRNEPGMLGMSGKVPPATARQHDSPMHGFGPKLKLLSLKPSSNTVKMAQKVTRTYNKQRDPRLPSSPRKGSSRRSPFPSPRKSGPAKKKEQIPLSTNIVKLPTPEEIAKAIACDDDDDTDHLTIDTETRDDLSTNEKTNDKPDTKGPALSEASVDASSESVLSTKDKDAKRPSNADPCSDSNMFLKPGLPPKQTPSSLAEKAGAKSEDSLMDYAIGSTPAYTSESFPLKEDIYEGSMDSSQFGFNFDDNEIEEHGEALAFTGLVASTSPKDHRKTDAVTSAKKLPPTDDVVCSEIDANSEQMEVDVASTDAFQEREEKQSPGNTLPADTVVEDRMHQDDERVADEDSKTSSSASGNFSKSREATDLQKGLQSNKADNTVNVTTESSEVQTVEDPSNVNRSTEKEDFVQNVETTEPIPDNPNGTTTSVQGNAGKDSRQVSLVEDSPIKTARRELSVLDECSRDSLASSGSSDIDIETVDDPGIDVQVPFQVNADPVAEELSLHLESEDSGSESKSSFTASDSECSSQGSPVHVASSPNKDSVVVETKTENQMEKSPESERCEEKEEGEEEEQVEEDGLCESDDGNFSEANSIADLDIQLHPGENYAQLGIDETTNDEAQLVNKIEKDSNGRVSDTEQLTRSRERHDSRSDKTSFDLREKLKQRRRSRDKSNETKERRRTREVSPSRGRSSRSCRDDRREPRDNRTRSLDKRPTPRSDRHRQRSPRPRSPVRRHREKSRSRTPQRTSSRKPRSPRSEERARRPTSSSLKARLGNKTPRSDRSSRSGDERIRTKKPDTSRRR